MKPILLVINTAWIPRTALERLSVALTRSGFGGIFLTTRRPESPELQMFNLADLPQADLDLVKKLVSDASQI